MNVYIAHRLFAAHDRWLAGLIAERMRTVRGARVFLPYCDTDQHRMVAADKGYRLFMADLQRLPDVDVVVALLHGPSYDDGICFEVGYAHAVGAHVLGVTSDFQTFSAIDDPSVLQTFSDPILDAVCDDLIVQADREPAAGVEDDARYESFRAGQAEVCESLAAEVVERVERRSERKDAPTVEQNRLYVEPDYYRASAGETSLAEAVGHEDLTYVASRGRPAADAQSAQRDLDAMRHASAIVVDGHGPEAPPGAAIALGIAVACEKRSILYFSGPTTSLAEGREPNDRNLMLLYGASVLARSPEAVSQAVRTWTRAWRS